MTKQTKIIIGVCVAVLVIVAIAYYVRKRNADGKGWSWTQTGTTETIPEELQKSINGFDDGETVTVSGIQYIKQNGAWAIVKS